jgi:hypothetical protein
VEECFYVEPATDKHVFQAAIKSAKGVPKMANLPTIPIQLHSENSSKER